jgi:hypothetical protein
MYLGLGGGAAFGVVSLVLWGLRRLDAAAIRKDQDRRGCPVDEYNLADGSFLPALPGREVRR